LGFGLRPGKAGLTYADVAAMFHLLLAALAIQKICDEDGLADVPGIPD
jgi:hypothetical protein